MIGMKTAYLVAVDTWQMKGADTPFAVLVGDRKEGTISGWADLAGIMCRMMPAPDPACLVSYSPSGLPTSSSTVYKSNGPVPGRWAERVVNAYIGWHMNTDYLAWKVIVRITPETVGELIRLNRVECTTEVVELLEALFPTCTGEHVLVRGDFPAYPFVVYVEPERACSEEYVGAREYAAAVVGLLGQAKAVPQPHHFAGVILTHGIGAGTVDRHLFAAGLEPLPVDPEPDHVIALPRVVLDIAAYLQYAEQLQHVARRLRNLPFYSKQVMEYVARLKDKGTLHTGYATMFLSDRESQVSQQVRAAEILDEIRRLLERNYVSIYSASPYPSSDSINLSDPKSTPVTFDVFEEFADVVPRAERHVSEAMRLISGRVTALSDFLRDRVMIDTTAANVLLQRRILYFTIVVTACTLVSMIIAIVTFVKSWWPSAW